MIFLIIISTIERITLKFYLFSLRFLTLVFLYKALEKTLSIEFCNARLTVSFWLELMILADSKIIKMSSSKIQGVPERIYQKYFRISSLFYISLAIMFFWIVVKCKVFLYLDDFSYCGMKLYVLIKIQKFCFFFFPKKTLKIIFFL